MTINSTARLNNLTPFRRPRHAAERETAWSGGQDTPARGNRASLLKLTLRKTPSSAVSQLAPQIKDRKKTASEKHDRSHSWGGAHTTSHGMTDTELRSLSDTNLNAHGGPRAPRDPLLEKDHRSSGNISDFIQDSEIQ